MTMMARGVERTGVRMAKIGLDILHIEDDSRTAADLQELMRATGDRVTWAPTGSEGLRQAGVGEFDVIILDRMLPDFDGLTVVRQLRDSGIGTPLLMLSALGRTIDRAEGLDAGADDYLAKPFEATELLARLRALHRRASGQAHSAVLIYGAFECHVKARTAFRAGEHLPLSPREFDLFHYLMEHGGDVVTREMLLKNVWNIDFDPQTNVVDVHVGRLRRKLEKDGGPPAIETIWGSGYRLLQGH